MDESLYLRDAGRDLAEYAYQIPEEFARSRSEILFPFIFMASKKMSSRAISRWLAEKRGVEFSAASVAKLLRESARYFQQIVERVQPLAEHVAIQFGMSVETLLFAPYGEDFIEEKMRNSFHDEEGQDYTDRVLSDLNDEWFSLDEEIRFRCKPYFEFESETAEPDDE